jgi:hypothetical protein
MITAEAGKLRELGALEKVGAVDPDATEVFTAN